MEKGFRIVRCPHCAQKLRIRVTSKEYGKIVEIVCGKCKTKMRATIPAPPPEKWDPNNDYVGDSAYRDLIAVLLGQKKY